METRGNRKEISSDIRVGNNGNDGVRNNGGERRDIGSDR